MRRCVNLGTYVVLIFYYLWISNIFFLAKAIDKIIQTARANVNVNVDEKNVLCKYNRLNFE